MRRGAQKREEILALSAELFATKGIAATTVRDIGVAASVHSGSLYHHFSSKDVIVGEILGRFMADVQQRFQAAVDAAPTPADRVRGLIRETLRVIDAHPHATAMYQHDRQYLREHGLLEPVDDASRTVRGFWLGAIADGVADGTFRDDVPAEVFYRTVRDSLWATMHWPTRRHHDTEEFADVMAALFFDGFTRAADRPARARREPSARSGRG
ncbi:TetR/AcrR family transcriptional regulator [Nocardioides sp. YIM 152315]|uniref:TetR/AcrR family transcriptional regulator n=1 Tax=Nocardioides sp. YIM 152315 TaxID=3031760 RepID=UPI0023DADB47|nr:TetR/AcrR family transcriptional regulator [Nocardioides sp. YIM 152315]MDF1604729.1 TetR/AcrR family transcriptional regulator [Nocardioides sp. YIM 152315]